MGREPGRGLREGSGGGVGGVVLLVVFSRGVLAFAGFLHCC